MRIKFLCIIICLFVNALVFASATNHTITGVVISGEDNEPLIGASVYVHADDLKKIGYDQSHENPPFNILPHKTRTPITRARSKNPSVTV